MDPIGSVTADEWIQNEVELVRRLQEQIHWDSIPLLNVNDVQNLQDKKLVRFRGMVQDMFNPEYYYEQYEVFNKSSAEKYMRNGRFHDFTACKEEEAIDLESENNVTKERHTLVVITVPGLNDWVHSVLHSSYAYVHPYKIQIEKEKHTIAPAATQLSQNIPNKRSLESDHEMETEPIQTPNADNNKKRCTSDTTDSKNLSPDNFLNFPLPERSGKACHVKLYNDAKKVKLNELVEVVGFLSVDPLLTEVSHDEGYVNQMEVQIHNPPPSLIPRIHCVSFKKLVHYNPLLKERTLDAADMPNIKNELHTVLTQLLLGDALAAEYLIYHLISKIYGGYDTTPLGKFAVNIFNVPVDDVLDFGRHLSEFIGLLVPASHYLPMTLKNMNEVAFVPKKDYDCDRLTSGLLQLSSNTHLILDETKLKSGRLNESGVKAVSALLNAIKDQITVYDFNYYPVEFKCHVNFLILSEGKTLLTSDYQIRLNPDNVCVQTYEQILEAARAFLRPDLLNNIRVYLTQTRHGNYEFNDDLNELIQNDYVRLRQTQSIHAEDLHQLLVLARAICLSDGKSQLDVECWRKACNLEFERKKRFQ